jgi:uncharacterized protein DUF3592
MASVEEFATRLASNRGKILRYAWIPQALTGLFLLGLSYHVGNAHFRLIREGTRTPGRIIGYKQQYFRSSSGATYSAYMPVVEFHTSDRVVQYQDWKGTSIAGSVGVPVMILYDPAEPTIAMIDRPVWNWIPWAPIFAVGLFLVLVAIKGAFRPLS